MGGWFRLVSLGFGAAGLSKVARMRQQRALFHSWGWPDDIMVTIGGLELGGAVLMSNRRTRHIGAATVAATSVAVLAAELEHGQSQLGTARVGMLLAALSATL